MYVMGKFKGKLDRDELKKFAKEVSLSIVDIVPITMLTHPPSWPKSS